MQLGKIEYRDELRNWNSPLPLNYASAVAGMTQPELMAMFASAWLPRAMGLDQCANLDRQQYENMISLHDKYEPRTQQVFANFITSFLNNAQNNYLFDIVAPPFQTDELNFKTLKEEIMQVGCDDLEEGGIASEGSTTRWGWHDDLARAATRRQISEELALDVNYGGETILKTLADIGQNVVYHSLRSVMHSVREIAYSNIVRQTMSDEHIDLSKLYAAEAEAFHIFAKDPHGALKLMIKKAVQFQGDLAIVKEGATQYLALVGKETEARQIPAQTVTYNRSTGKFTGMPKEGGPMSFLSYRLGDRWFDIIENTSWQVSSRSSFREDPLEVTTVNGQFYAPNPDYRADDEVVSTNPDVIATILYYQTKTQDGDRKVSFVDCLRNCFRWDTKTGKHSKQAKDFVEQLNTNLTISNGRDRPFQYEQRTQNQNGDEEGDYDNPSPAAMKYLREQDTDDFRQMKSIRDIPSGVVYDPLRGEYRNAKRIGDYHLDQLPNAWLMRLIRSLRLKYEEENKRNIMVDFDRIYAWLENVSNAAWTKEYVYALIDANLPKDGTADYFVDNGVLEFKLNNRHCLNIPASEDPRTTGMRYAPGFQSGAGMLVAKDLLLRKGTNFVPMAEEAVECIAAATNIIRFLKKYLVKSDVIDYENAPDWFQIKKETNDTVLIAFIDAIYPSEGPIFFAVPDTRDKTIDPTTRATGETLTTYLNDDGRDLRTLGEIDVNSVYKGGVEASVRALSYLSRDTAQTYRKFILGNTDGRADNLIKYINEFSGGKNAKAVEDNRFILNAVTEEYINFYISSEATAQKLSSDFITNLRNDAASLLPKLKLNKLFKDTSQTINKIITTWEADSAKRDNVKPGALAEKDIERNYKNLGKTKYLRSPLIQSPTFRLFVQQQTQEWAWALPGDPNSNYTTPIYTVNKINTSFEERGFMSYFQQLSGKMPILNAMPHAFLGSGLGGMTEEELLGLGVPYEDSRQARMSVENVEVKEDEVLVELRREYFGPWQNRMEFQDNINDRTDKALFKAILESRDSLFFHEGIAKLGGKVINMMLMRPCITTRSSCAIVMKAGIGTIGTPMSRLIVDLTKEARGYLTITTSFYIGTLRVTPSAIAMLYAAIPVDFIGGKTVAFIKSANELFELSRDRGSLIAIPIPISENIFDHTLTLDNGQAMQRPDTYETAFSGKWSGAAFLCSIFGAQDIGNIYGHHCNRTQFKCQMPPVAFVLHNGPRSFIDQRTGNRVDHEGSGPGGERCMNMTGAYAVANGTATWYPTVTPTTMTRARAQ